MALFEAFLAKEHSLENLHFYTRVQRFKRDASDLSAEALATEARDVVATFLDDDAEELVNLEARVRGPVVSAVHNAAAAGAVTAAVFDHAANAALKLMAFDSFSRFLCAFFCDVPASVCSCTHSLGMQKHARRCSMLAARADTAT